uniref:U2A'/phosphoprotein 32 family A C-terminal domain-containing protein n=1 Tax=Stomoxys calcitrans TaxID=35570 RepID=A0A1I8NMZ8_STOCA
MDYLKSDESDVDRNDSHDGNKREASNKHSHITLKHIPERDAPIQESKQPNMHSLNTHPSTQAIYTLKQFCLFTFCDMAHPSTFVVCCLSIYLSLCLPFYMYVKLNLSHRNLLELDTDIIATHGEYIEYLDVSHNRIARLEWLLQLPQLKCLIMDDNRLREAHFEKLKKMHLPNITTLTLNKNELSDLDTTAKILQYMFPNLEYLSLHGNPMCPDNLYLQPFSEFVPYEYAHYRSVLSKSLPRLKFLDHYALDSFPLAKHQQQSQQLPTFEQSHSISKDIWSKIKSLLLNNNNKNQYENNCYQPYPTTNNSAYKGLQSEGNRFITNSDL